MKKLVYITVITLLLATSSSLTSCTIEEMEQYENAQNGEVKGTYENLTQHGVPVVSTPKK